MLNCQCQCGRSPLSSIQNLAAEQGDLGPPDHRLGDTCGVSGGLSHRNGLLTALHRLVRIAEHPKRPRDIRQADFAGVLDVTQRVSAVGLNVVQGDPPLQMITGSLELAGEEAHHPDGALSLHQITAFPRLLAEREQLLGRFLCRRQLGPEHVVEAQPLQHGGEAGRITHRSAEIPGATVHCRHLGVTVAFCGHEQRTQGGQQIKLLLVALGAFGQRPQQLQATVKMSRRLGIGRALGGELSGTLPAADRLGGQACFGQVVRQYLGLALDEFRESVRATPRRPWRGAAAACF